jgi:hypothetical protein
VTLGDALCSRLLGRLESSEDSDRLLDVAPSLDATDFFSASTIAALTQRTTIEPLCQRFTFFEYQAIPLLRFSIAFVVRSFRYRRPSTPRLWSVRVSSSPSRTEDRRPRMFGFERGRQPFEPPLGDGRVVHAPSLSKHHRHVRMQVIRKVAQDVAQLVDLAALDLRKAPERLLDRRDQRRGSVDHEQPAPLRIEAARHEVPQQRPDHLAVLRGSLPKAQNLLLPLD